MKRTTYSMSFKGPGWRGELALLASIVALLVACWWMADKGLPALGFDGMLGAGCDWGSPNCDEQDYRWNCEHLDPTPYQVTRFCPPPERLEKP